MKRRTTKKALRETEIMLVDSLRLYFNRPRESAEESQDKLSRDIVALSLSMLLSFHLQLRSIRLINKRWIQKLFLADVTVEESGTVRGQGEINWGEMKENREVAQAGSFGFKIKVTDMQRNRVEYELTYEQDGTQRIIKSFARRAV